MIGYYIYIYTLRIVFDVLPARVVTLPLFIKQKLFYKIDVMPRSLFTMIYESINNIICYI